MKGSHLWEVPIYGRCPFIWVGTGGQEPGEIEKNLQHFVIFCNRNGTKRREPLRKGAGSRRVRLLCPHPHLC